MDQYNDLISEIQNANKTLFILCGYPYSGKSYVANRVREHVDIVFVSIDNIFHSRGYDWNTNVLPNREGWEQIFSESYEKTRNALSHGSNVLYDSTNQTVTSRDTLREVAQAVGAKTSVVYVKTPVETVWQRWKENQGNPTRSIVSKELVQMTIDMFEEPTNDECVMVVNNP